MNPELRKDFGPLPLTNACGQLLSVCLYGRRAVTVPLSFHCLLLERDDACFKCLFSLRKTVRYIQEGHPQ